MRNSKTHRMIISELEKAIRSVQRELKSKGFNYTGFASASMEIKDNTTEKEYNLQLWGADYIEFLAEGKGRGKTRNKGNGVATKRIFEWVERKLAPLLGITDENEIEELKINVARKIHSAGTAVRRKTRKGIDLNKIIDTLEKNIQANLADTLKVDVVERLDKYTKLFKKHSLNI